MVINPCLGGWEPLPDKSRRKSLLFPEYYQLWVQNCQKTTGPHCRRCFGTRRVQWVDLLRGRRRWHLSRTFQWWKFQFSISSFQFSAFNGENLSRTLQTGRLVVWVLHSPPDDVTVSDNFLSESCLWLFICRYFQSYLLQSCIMLILIFLLT